MPRGGPLAWEAPEPFCSPEGWGHDDRGFEVFPGLSPAGQGAMAPSLPSPTTSAQVPPQHPPTPGSSLFPGDLRPAGQQFPPPYPDGCRSAVSGGSPQGMEGLGLDLPLCPQPPPQAGGLAQDPRGGTRPHCGAQSPAWPLSWVLASPLPWVMCAPPPTPSSWPSPAASCEVPSAPWASRAWSPPPWHPCPPVSHGGGGPSCPLCGGALELSCPCCRGFGTCRSPLADGEFEAQRA